MGTVVKVRWNAAELSWALPLISDGVLEAWPWPRGASRPNFEALALASDIQALRVKSLALGHGLGLESRPRPRPGFFLRLGTLKRVNLLYETQNFRVQNARELNQQLNTYC